MKAVMILLDQAHYDLIVDNLSRLNIRGVYLMERGLRQGSSDGDCTMDPTPGLRLTMPSSPWWRMTR